MPVCAHNIRGPTLRHAATSYLQRKLPDQEGTRTQCANVATQPQLHLGCQTDYPAPLAEDSFFLLIEGRGGFHFPGASGESEATQHDCDSEFADPDQPARSNRHLHHIRCFTKLFHP